MMVRTFCVYLLISISLLPISFGQKRDCYTDAYLATEIKSNPRRMEIINQIERHIRDYEKSASGRNDVLVTIPVVVHIVYNDAPENISETQILSQIDVLNKDFRRRNTDKTNNWTQAADSGIEFCLAKTDPSGKSTNGITRTYTNLSSFSTSGDAIKFNTRGGKDAWPADRYLNIWVCDIAGTVLGYAQFPGGKAETDGVVIDYKVFGTGPNVNPGFQLGRTTTHEVGHWLNLKHIWGSADCTTDDLVSDTPQSDAPNYGCAKGHWSCGSLDMIENYMDYSNDDCMNLFTNGQKSRMQSLFTPNGFRYNITQSNGCNLPVSNNAYCGKINIDITFDNYPQETSWEIKNEKGLVVLNSPKYLSSQKNTSIKIDACLVAGCYTFTINDIYSDGICCKYGNGSYKLTADGKAIASGGAFGKSGSHNFCITQTQPTCTDGIKNGSETGIDCGGTSCPVCPTCSDGVKNGRETGNDCGGPDCKACPTCSDGIKNGSETNVDCGGPECKPCNGGNVISSSNSGVLLASYFETGWDNWVGGATDTERYKGNFSWEGDYSILIRDNTGDESGITSQEIDIRAFAAVKIEFAFFSYSMEKDEDFWLMYHDGTKWNTLKAYVSERDFYNNNFYEVTFLMDASKYNFISKGKFRFQCDASTNADEIYIDAVKITGIPQGSRIIHQDKVVSVGYHMGEEKLAETNILPNPASDHFDIHTKEEIKILKILDMSGRTHSVHLIEDIHKSIDISHLQPGLYLVNMHTEDKIISRKLVKK